MNEDYDLFRSEASSLVAWRGNSVMYLNNPDQKRRPAHVTVGWEQHTFAFQPLTPGHRAVVGRGEG